jgi:hypothetical protein
MACTIGAYLCDDGQQPHVLVPSGGDSSATAAAKRAGAFKGSKTGMANFDCAESEMDSDCKVKCRAGGGLNDMPKCSRGM